MNKQITPYENVIIVGCGDIGRRVASRWQAHQLEVTGLVTSQDSINKLEIQGVKACQINLDMTDPVIPAIAANSLVYYFVPPPANGIIDTRVQHFLAQLTRQAILPRRIIAISTSGVYGDCGGDVVTEDKPPNPMVDRGRRRFDMEIQLRDWCEQNEVELVILRVGGIYGAKRLPLKRIMNRVPVLHESLAPKTNRIHEEDLADICVAAAKVGTRYRVYNVSDGTESNMTEYFYTLADHFNLPRPPAVDWQEAEQKLSKGMLSYLRESRRLDNSRMLKELDIKLQYPNLKQALSKIDPKTIQMDD
jgi:nucleoside-diphosphate-sugar epimerase